MRHNTCTFATAGLSMTLWVSKRADVTQYHYCPPTRTNGIERGSVRIGLYHQHPCCLGQGTLLSLFPFLARRTAFRLILCLANLQCFFVYTLSPVFVKRCCIWCLFTMRVFDEHHRQLGTIIICDIIKVIINWNSILRVLCYLTLEVDKCRDLFFLLMKRRIYGMCRQCQFAQVLYKPG